MRSSLAVAAATVLLVPTMAQAQHHHDDQSAKVDTIHSHRGPGPHFIDAFFTENAYLERKLRPDVAYATGPSGAQWTGRLEVEWAVHRSASLIVHAPLHRLEESGAPSVTGIGDVSLGLKAALVNDRRSFILATGLDVELPTGDESDGLGEGHTALAPFLLAWLPLGHDRRWLLQAAAHLDFPLTHDPERHGFFSAAASWTSPLGVTPLLEAMAEVPLQHEEPTRWSLAPGFRWEFAEAWEVGASVRLPLGQAREEDVRVTVGLIRHFPLPY